MYIYIYVLKVKLQGVNTLTQEEQIHNTVENRQLF